MEPDCLTQLKHIGKARMKLLNAHGLTTIEQLYNISLEKLARIKTIGKTNAKRIKDAVHDYYAQKGIRPPEKPAAAKAKKDVEDAQWTALRKQIKRIQKRLKTVSEKLKPLWEKKYLGMYIDFKKKSNKLKSLLKDIEQTRDALSKKSYKKITKKTDILNDVLKSVKKKPNRKRYIEITQEVESITKALKKIVCE